MPFAVPDEAVIAAPAPSAAGGFSVPPEAAIGFSVPKEAQDENAKAMATLAAPRGVDPVTGTDNPMADDHPIPPTYQEALKTPLAIDKNTPEGQQMDAHINALVKDPTYDAAKASMDAIQNGDLGTPRIALEVRKRGGGVPATTSTTTEKVLGAATGVGQFAAGVAGMVPRALDTSSKAWDSSDLSNAVQALSNNEPLDGHHTQAVADAIGMPYSDVEKWANSDEPGFKQNLISKIADANTSLAARANLEAKENAAGLASGVQGASDQLKGIGNAAQTGMAKVGLTDPLTHEDYANRLIGDITSLNRSQHFQSGNVMNDSLGNTADLEAQAGQKFNQNLAPELSAKVSSALQAAGVPKDKADQMSSSGPVDVISAASNPANLAMAEGGQAIGAGTGAAFRAAGATADVIGNAVPKIISHLPGGKVTASVLGTAGALEGIHAAINHPEAAAIGVSVGLGALGLGKMAPFLSDTGTMLMGHAPDAELSSPQIWARNVTGQAASQATFGAGMSAAQGNDPRTVMQDALSALPWMALHPATFGRPTDLLRAQWMGAASKDGASQYTNNPAYSNHAETMAKLDPDSQAGINALRSTLFRGLGTDTLVVNQEGYDKALAAAGQAPGSGETRGVTLQPIFHSGDGTIYINADAFKSDGAPTGTGAGDTLGHETGHAILKALGTIAKGADATTLQDMIRKSMTPDDLAKLTANYKKDAGSNISVDPVEEQVAEQTRNLLNDKGLAGIAVPSIRDKVAGAFQKWMQTRYGNPVQDNPGVKWSGKEVSAATDFLKNTIYDASQRTFDAIKRQGQLDRGEVQPNTMERMGQIDARLREINAMDPKTAPATTVDERQKLQSERTRLAASLPSPPSPAPNVPTPGASGAQSTAPQTTSVSTPNSEINEQSRLRSLGIDPDEADEEWRKAQQAAVESEARSRGRRPFPDDSRDKVAAQAGEDFHASLNRLADNLQAHGEELQHPLNHALLINELNHDKNGYVGWMHRGSPGLEGVSPVQPGEFPKPGYTATGPALANLDPTKPNESNSIPSGGNENSEELSSHVATIAPPVPEQGASAVPTPEKIAATLDGANAAAEVRKARARGSASKPVEVRHAEIEHEERVDALTRLLPATGEGLHREVDPDTKEVSIRGNIDPANPLHDAILKEHGQTPEQVASVVDLQNRQGKGVWLRQYQHAAQGEDYDDSAAKRNEEYSASPTSGKQGEREGAVTEADKPFTPYSTVLTKNGVNIRGLDHDKLLQNVDKVATEAERQGQPTGLEGIKGQDRDNAVAEAFRNIAQNHANGWKGDGSAALKTFPDSGIKQNPDYIGKPVDKDLANVINMAMNYRGALTPERPVGSRPDKAPTTGALSRFTKNLDQAKEAQNLSQINQGHLNPVTGETNPLRDALEKGGFDTVKELKPTTANIRPDLIKGGIDDEPATARTVHPHGFDIPPAELTPEGTPRRKQTLAGFMPKSEEEDPYSIKSNSEKKALGNFMPGSHKDDVSDLGFYSGLGRIIDAKIPNRASGEQIKATLEGAGAKKEEMESMGLPEFLKTHDGPINKQELQDFVRAGGVQLQEVQKSNDVAKSTLSPDVHIQENEDGTWTLHSNSHEVGPFNSEQEAEDFGVQYGYTEADSSASDASPATKFSPYVLPGGSNYKEVLLTLPEDRRTGRAVKTGELSDGSPQWKVTMRDGREISGVEGATPEEAVQTVKNNTSSSSDKPFTSSHWDEPNVLAHIRQADHTDTEGSKVRLIEEIQSDWHQKGRKEGYKPTEVQLRSARDKRDAASEALASLRQLRDTTPEDSPMAEKLAPKIEQAAKELGDAREALAGLNSNVPDAPFKRTWAELAFKRALRMAVDDGQDKIAWTPGEQQAERYDLSKQIKSIDAWRMDDEKGLYDLHTVDKNDGRHRWNDIPAQKLPDLVGKEMAEKIVNHPDIADKGAHLSGLDLKVGGEGMKGFYDKILPSFVSKYVKPMGGKVETTELDADEKRDAWKAWDKNGQPLIHRNENGAGIYFPSEQAAREAIKGNGGTMSHTLQSVTTPVHSVTITPQMRESISKGQPMFMPKGQEDDGALSKFNPAKKDDSIYRAPGKTIDVSDDTSNLPKGWTLQQDGGLWIAKDDQGKRVSATGSRAGTLQAALRTANEQQPIDTRTGTRTLIPSGRLTPEQSQAAAHSIRSHYRSYSDAVGKAVASNTDEDFGKVADSLPKTTLDKIGLKIDPTTRAGFSVTDPADTLKSAGSPGGESSTFLDGDVAYKVFYPQYDWRTGSPQPDGVGIRGQITPDPISKGWKLEFVGGNMGDVLEKLHVLGASGGVPSELIGVTPEGAVIVKQPKYAEPPGQQVRRGVLQDDNLTKNQMERPMGRDRPENTYDPVPIDLERVAVVDGKPYSISDLTGSNFAFDNHGNMRLADPVVGRIPQEMIDSLPALKTQIERLTAEENTNRSKVAFMPKGEKSNEELPEDNKPGDRVPLRGQNNNPEKDDQNAGADQATSGVGKGEKLSFTHYSGTPGLDTLDPSKHGTGALGAESVRRKAYPDRYVPRTYVGLDGYEKEAALGKHEYKGSVDPSLIYNIAKDPLNLTPLAQKGMKEGDFPGMDQGRFRTEMERQIKDHGFLGYKHGDVAALFHSIPTNAHVGPEEFAKSAPTYARRSPEMMRTLRDYVPNFDKIEGDYFDQKPPTPQQVSKQNEIANDYEKAKADNLSDPNVKRAYQALSDKVSDQYDKVLKGIKVEPWADKQSDGTWKARSGEPYKSSADMQQDLKDNKHLYFFTTESGFGSKGNHSDDNPMLQDSGKKTDNGYPLLNNDMFRAVHDAIAHGSFGTQFGPAGEEAAWKAHMATISDPWARWALTSETRGQNSWVNFRNEYLNEDGTPKKKGDEGYVPITERPFADQKADLLPAKHMLTGDRAVDEPVTNNPDFRAAAGLPSIIRDGEGKFMPTSGEETPYSIKSNSEEKPDRALANFMPKNPGKNERDPGLQDLNLGKKFTPEALSQQAVKRRTAATGDKFPEAIQPTYRKDENGKFLLDDEGRPSADKIDYNLTESPLAKDAIKGVRGDDKRKAAVTTAYADKLVQEYEKAKSDPKLMAGADWYDVARSKIKAHFGKDALLFAQLLGATSARTPARENYSQALEAYNLHQDGAYKGFTNKYLDLENKLENGTPMQFTSTYSKKVAGKTTTYEAGTPVTPTNFKFFLDQQGVLPKKSNGKEYNANSLQVLRVLAGNWENKVGGPKTPNFARNLSGEGKNPFEATIDVWAARHLHRLANEGITDKRWRILPESEPGVSDADFHLGQSAYREAADRIGIKPDSLQAVLWFAEKNHWEKNGWTRGTGAELSDFSSLLSKTVNKDGKKVLEKAPDPQQYLF